MSELWPNKIIIGLTGNIATGKSAIMRLAAAQGALTLDADLLVHEIMASDSQVQVAIESTFGATVRRQDSSIDRAALGAIAFKDADALRKLERLLHPAVGREVGERIMRSNARIIMIEAIKLLEGDLAKQCDQIWVTDCTRRRQIERLTICRGLDEESAYLRVDAQQPQSEKVAQADVVIDTNGTMADSIAQFELAWDKLSLNADGV